MKPENSLHTNNLISEPMPIRIRLATNPSVGLFKHTKSRIFIKHVEHTHEGEEETEWWAMRVISQIPVDHQTVAASAISYLPTALFWLVIFCSTARDWFTMPTDRMAEMTRYVFLAFILTVCGSAKDHANRTAKTHSHPSMSPSYHIWVQRDRGRDRD